MKTSSYAKIYALGSQGIITMVLYGVIGFLIGYFAIGGPVWGSILAIIGVLLGLITFIGYLLYLQKDIDKEKKKNENQEENIEKVEDSNEEIKD